MEIRLVWFLFDCADPQTVITLEKQTKTTLCKSQYASPKLGGILESNLSLIEFWDKFAEGIRVVYII